MTDYPILRRMAAVFNNEEYCLIKSEFVRLMEHRGDDTALIERANKERLSLPQIIGGDYSPQGFAFWAGVNKTFRLRWTGGGGEWNQYQRWDLRNHEDLLNAK